MGIPRQGGFEHLDSLLQAWLSWRTEVKKGGERSIDITTFARHETGGDNHAMLRRVFDVILDDSFPTQSRKGHLKYFMRITSRCRAFFKSNVFRDGCRRGFPEAKMSYFFRHTARRLWRVQIYFSGALIFPATWMKHCRAIFNLKEPSFSGVWVANTVPKAVDFPISIRDTLADILHAEER